MIVTIKLPVFFSELDELLFLKLIEELSTTKPKGNGNQYSFTLKRSSNKTYIRNIFGLFKRFKIDMKCLNAIVNEQNRKYVCDPQKYWYDSLMK